MLTEKQFHKLLILFLILAYDEVSNTDITNSHAAIRANVADIPSAVDVLDAWVAGTVPSDTRRPDAQAALSSFLSFAGNGWGGNGNCPGAVSDPTAITTMTGWLANI